MKILSLMMTTLLISESLSEKVSLDYKDLYFLVSSLREDFQRALTAHEAVKVITTTYSAINQLEMERSGGWRRRARYGIAGSKRRIVQGYSAVH